VGEDAGLGGTEPALASGSSTGSVAGSAGTGSTGAEVLDGATGPPSRSTSPPAVRTPSATCSKPRRPHPPAKSDIANEPTRANTRWRSRTWTQVPPWSHGRRRGLELIFWGNHEPRTYTCYAPTQRSIWQLASPSRK